MTLDPFLNPPSELQWPDFTQLIVVAPPHQLLQYLKSYLKSLDLFLIDVTNSPEMWDDVVFLYDYQATAKTTEKSTTYDDLLASLPTPGNHFTLLSEPETLPPNRQLQDEFASHFMRHCKLDGTFIANDTHLDLHQLITFKTGEESLVWFDSHVPGEHLGDTMQITPNDDDDVDVSEEEEEDVPIPHASEPLSYITYRSVDGGMCEVAAHLYQQQLLGYDINPLDELAKYHFVEKVLAHQGLPFYPTTDHLEIAYVLQFSEEPEEER